jgi:LacI family transcriptional regulator
MTGPPSRLSSSPIRQIGDDALAMLVRLIRGEPFEETHLTMATRLVVRHSTRAM